MHIPSKSLWTASGRQALSLRNILADKNVFAGRPVWSEFMLTKVIYVNACFCSKEAGVWVAEVGNAVAEWLYEWLLIKILDIKAQVSSPGWYYSALLVTHNYCISIILLGRTPGSLHLGSPGLCCIHLFLLFILSYHFAVINCNQECNSFSEFYESLGIPNPLI